MFSLLLWLLQQVFDSVCHHFNQVNVHNSNAEHLFVSVVNICLCWFTTSDCLNCVNLNNNLLTHISCINIVLLLFFLKNLPNNLNSVC